MQPPGTDWREVVADGEPSRLEELAKQLHDLQRESAKRRGHASRALHMKAHAGVEGELSVLGELPAHARVGLFATPSTYRAYVRFSNGGPARRRDARADERGVAIKLLGVPGKKIIPGLEDATTQDFLFIRGAATPFRDAEEFVWFARAARSPALLVPRALARFGPRRTLQLVRDGLRNLTPTASLATSRFYSAVPIQFGQHAIKYALEPHAQSDANARRRAERDYLRDDLVTRLAREPIAYDFRIQFYVDEARTPIEDASVVWKETDSPFITVARLTLPRQDLRSPRALRLAEYIETLSFDPWHAGVDFKPLGNMMRARNVAYRLSTQERRAAPEPDGTERFD